MDSNSNPRAKHKSWPQSFRGAGGSIDLGVKKKRSSMEGRSDGLFECMPWVR